eukprot:m.69387 g.69387  ORF g.69387 m.69387 type:complete len:673 (-) comp16026_c0_seq8:252-2270(-)
MSESGVAPCVNLSVTTSRDIPQLTVKWDRGKSAESAMRDAALRRDGRVPLSYSYRLFLRQVDHSDSDSDATCVMDSKDTSYVCGGLCPNTSYEVYVETYCIPIMFPGEGPTCKAVVAKTCESAPEMPPQNLRPTNASLDEITVTWEPPQTTAGDIIGYRLLYDTASVSTYHEVEFPASIRTYTASLLDPDHEYRFQVCAFTGAGEGPLSDVVKVSTLESAAARRARLLAGGQASATAAPTATPAHSGGHTRRMETPADAASVPGARAALRKTSNDDWKQMRVTGEHRKGRKTIKTWIPDPASSGNDGGDTARATPQPRSLLETRPTGASAGFEPEPSRPIARTVQPGPTSGTWFSHDAPTEDQEQEWLPDMSNLPSGNRAPHEKRSSLAQRYYSRIKDGPPPDDTADEEEAPSAAQPAVVMTPTATTGSTTRRVSAISYPKPKQPEPTPVPVVVRQSSKRLLTAAERTGSAQAIPIEGHIRGKDGIRGKKNAVRARLEVITGRELLGGAAKPTKLQLLFDEEKRGQKLVMYTTTNSVVRSTYSRCNALLKIFDFMRVKVHRKDVYLDPALADELQLRCPGKEVPMVFAAGILLGDDTKVQELNETGDLKKILKDYEQAAVADCTSCGGSGYTVCSWCQGSLKSLRVGTGAQGVRTLKCTLCNSNGLQRCPAC